jgi:Domain of unknown function (DUF378)
MNVYGKRSVEREPSLLEAEQVQGRSLVALFLVVVGAVNWDLVGVTQFDLVATLFGGQSAPMSRVVYSRAHASHA